MQLVNYLFVIIIMRTKYLLFAKFLRLDLEFIIDILYSEILSRINISMKNLIAYFIFLCLKH